jgi:S-DNA-T family DNA segregation ATPase FtsK/SpoIIIE
LNHIEQLATAGTTPADSTRLPFRIRPLPTRIHLTDLASRDDVEPVARAAGWVSLGAGGDDASSTVIAASGAEARFLIAGPPRSGRSTALVTVGSQLVVQRVGQTGDARKSGSAPLDPLWRLIVAAGSRSALHRWAGGCGVATVTPSGQWVATAPSDDPVMLAELSASETPIVLLIDDCEQFNDTTVGEQLAALIRSAPVGLSVFAAGRSDELAVTYRGIGVELRRARTGLLLQPGPGDAEMFGQRLPYSRSTLPPGRGYLIAEELLRSAPPAGRVSAVPIQVALP